jgi:O-antigen biosynthesis protein
MRIGFVMPNVNIGGGCYVVLQHAHYLSEQGHDVCLVLSSPVDEVTRAWHPGLRTIPLLSVEAARQLRFEIIVVAFWSSAGTALLLDTAHFVYFAQGMEPLFYPREQVALRSAVRQVYSLGLPVITVGTDIKEYLEREHGAQAWLAQNGIDKSVFSPDGPSAAAPVSRGLRVLVEGPLGVEFKNVPRSVHLARKSGAEEVWLLTKSPVVRYPGADRVFSQVPSTETARIYRACDVLLKLSLVEGFGLPPLEMFCCGGTAVLYDVSGYRDFVRHGVNALVCNPYDESEVVDSLRRLQRDSALLNILRSNAVDTGTSWPDWAAASERFTACLDEITAGPAFRRSGQPDRLARMQRIEAVLPESRPLPLWRRALELLPPWLKRYAFEARILWWGHVASRRQPRGSVD